MNDNKVFIGYNSIFALRLRELMSERKTTQKELAEIVGTTRQAISQYADGSVQPNIEKLYKITNYFRVSCDWLVGASDIRSSDVDKIAMSKKLGLSQTAIEYLSYLSINPDYLRTVENELKTINFLLSDDYENRIFLLPNIAKYFYDSEILEICKKAHIHHKMIVTSPYDEEFDFGERIIDNFLNEEDVLNMMLLETQKSLVKAMEYERSINTKPDDDMGAFGEFNITR